MSKLKCQISCHPALDAGSNYRYARCLLDPPLQGDDKISFKLLTLVLIFAFCVLSFTSSVHAQTVTPDPLPCDDVEHHIERSLFQNPGFEDEFINGVPKYWTWFKEGNTDIFEETVNEKWFRAGIKIIGNGAFKAGVYQTVDNLTVGKWYHAFYATAQQMWGPNGKDDGLPIKREVGVDLNGGTNPNAANVIWGRWSGCDKKDGCLYGTWHTLGLQNNPLVSFKATTNKVTVFLKAVGNNNITNSDTWIDETYLVEACQQNVGGSAPSLIPTKIPFSQPTLFTPSNTPYPTSIMKPISAIPTRYIAPTLNIPQNQTSLVPTPIPEVKFSIKINNPYKPYRRINQINFTAGEKSINLRKPEETFSLPITDNYGKFKLTVTTSDNFTFSKSGSININRENKINLTLASPIFLITKSFSEFVFDKVDLLVKFINILDKPFK